MERMRGGGGHVGGPRKRHKAIGLQGGFFSCVLLVGYNRRACFSFG